MTHKIQENEIYQETQTAALSSSRSGQCLAFVEQTSSIASFKQPVAD